MERLEQRLERAWRQWPQSVRCFMRRERVKAVLLVDQLRLIRKKHCIPIKSDSQLVGVTAGSLRGLRVYARGRTFGIQCAKYVALISGQEQIGFERFEVSVGRAAARKDTPFNSQPRLLRRAKHPQSRNRIVLRQDDHLDALLRRTVEPQQLLYERKCHAVACRDVETLVLELDVRRLAVALEYAVLLLEVEQRARRDRDHQLPFDRLGHCGRYYAPDILDISTQCCYVSSQASHMITSRQLRAARALTGIDQRALAKASRLSLPTIQRMEASDGVIRGNVESLMKLIADR